MSRTLPPLQTVSTGFVVAIVGFFSSFPVVLQGLDAMGATPAQQASGLMAASFAMGLSAIALSLWSKQPVSVAWSTPGAALLAASQIPEAGFAGAVGAFLLAGALTVIAGLWKPLNRLTNMIPVPLAQAMLAGVLLSLCIKPFQALAEIPMMALPIILTWFIVSLFSRVFAVPAAVLVSAFVVAANAGFDLPAPDQLIGRPVLTAPEFNIADLLSIGLPLFIVTMATQNIPGLAVLRSYGYQPRSGPSVASVGLASILSAPFGALATCLAAITAAMCANEESHPDPAQRYWSAASSGVFYCSIGLFSAVITGFAGLTPPLVLGTVAGVALLGVFANSTVAALEEADYRQSAAITFLVTASGVALLGLSAAVWGLVIGGIVQVISDRVKRKS
ncbi:benzoate/H(+) symporter BenE family transporter [Phaeobacter marinintestinus]|uniref:benzoate/H(+) symporter BenE family transporter n=1 Tax=Falsiphaeobacter marinintestinus TaxID=1492905 RepID=UPI0011B7AD07|nr:benzoate/H(+) symporter BenE family transporter [Phaeobacter marinintestinus]